MSHGIVVGCRIGCLGRVPRVRDECHGRGGGSQRNHDIGGCQSMRHGILRVHRPRSRVIDPRRCAGVIRGGGNDGPAAILATPCIPCQRAGVAHGHVTHDECLEIVGSGSHHTCASLIADVTAFGEWWTTEALDRLDRHPRLLRKLGDGCACAKAGLDVPRAERVQGVLLCQGAYRHPLTEVRR